MLVNAGIRDQVVRLRLGDGDRDVIAWTDLAVDSPLEREVHETPVARAAGHALGAVVLAAILLHKELLARADELRVLLRADALLQREQALAAGKTFAAYCYAAGGENHWLKSSARRFGSVDEEQVREFIASAQWVDVFAHVRTYLVGTDGLGLKALGPVVGFEWEDDDIDGERSVALRRAARLGDAAARDMLLRYNEDDCRATRAVRDFLTAGAPGVPDFGSV